MAVADNTDLLFVVNSLLTWLCPLGLRSDLAFFLLMNNGKYFKKMAGWPVRLLLPLWLDWLLIVFSPHCLGRMDGRRGWEVEQVLAQLNTMDNNKFSANCGVGER